MLVRTREDTITFNLKRYDFICATDKAVYAYNNNGRALIAQCKSENDAILLERAISSEWAKGASVFDVDSWCHRNNNALK